MSEHELEKLLGGFAPDTLSRDEKERLFRAALKDQHLFNALADEQALKDLLANPAVRRSLLRALAVQHKGWRSWLDRFMTPAGLAWAGGVAVGVFAVVLGLRLYEDSLRQASESAVLQEGREQAPATEAERRESIPTRRPEPGAKDRLSSLEKSREQVATSRPQEPPVSTVERDKQQKLLQQQKPTDREAPRAAPAKSADQTDASTDQLRAQASSPVSQPGVHSLPKTKREAATAASARMLFYADAARPDPAATADEKESVQMTDRLALARKSPHGPAPARALALRYSFLSERQHVQPFEPHHSETVILTVESNQDAYLQVWKRAGDSLPELVIPTKETGHISLRTAGGERQRVTVSGDSNQLILRLSRVPFGPITRQEAVMAGRGSPGQVTESASGTEEPATYVANPDISAAELAIEIPITRSAR